MAKLNISKQDRLARRVTKCLAISLLILFIFTAVYPVISYQRMMKQQHQAYERLAFGKQVWREEVQSPFRSSQIKAEDTHVYVGLHEGGDLGKKDKKVFLTFENPHYTAPITQEDFEVKRTRTTLLQRMKKLGLRTLRYTNGQQEWRFNVPQ